MSRGRIIGVASLPVLLLGVPSFANEVNGTTPTPAPAGVVSADQEWAIRWKAAAAEAAARKVATNKAGKPQEADADWAARWQAASEELKARKASRKAPAARPAPARPAPTVIAELPEAQPLTLDKSQLLMLAPRRPKAVTEEPAPTEGTTPAPPPEGAAPAAPADAAAIPTADAATMPATTEPAYNPDDELVPIDVPAPFGYADSPFEKSR